MFKVPPAISHTPKATNMASSSNSNKPSGSDDDAGKTKSDAPAELSAVVDDLLDSLSKKFATVSSEMFEKMDAMSKRLDAMEQALNNSGIGTGAASGAAK